MLTSSPINHALQVIDATLKRYTIIKMESEVAALPGANMGGPKPAASLVFFVLRDRRGKGAATDAEEAAVGLSCNVRLPWWWGGGEGGQWVCAWAPGARPVWLGLCV